MGEYMNKTIKIIIIFLMIIILLGILYLFYNLFGTNSVNLKKITFSEKEDILELIGLNDIKDSLKLEKLETPKTYKDIYYVLYFSIDLNNKDKLNKNVTNNLDIDFSEIEKNNNIIRYRSTISNMGKSIEILEQIRDKYGK